MVIEQQITGAIIAGIKEQVIDGAVGVATRYNCKRQRKSSKDI